MIFLHPPIPPGVHSPFSTEIFLVAPDLEKQNFWTWFYIDLKKGCLTTGKQFFLLCIKSEHFHTFQDLLPPGKNDAFRI